MSSNRKTNLMLATLVLAWGVGVAPAQAADDSWITAKIKIALMTTDGAGRNAVKSDVEQGKVTLTGTVDSQAVKDKAEATVRAVGGVTQVQNLIQVVKPSRQEATHAVDKDVEAAVHAALRTDKNLEAVHIKSVENGLVFLDGSTTGYAHTLLAIEKAYAVTGVRQVVSGIVTKEK
ncbi:MAG: BON domain-containing protein [Vicinamibacteria bacterium]|nr:BON domain-containing protein [Vicinamibacteria bacterium]